MGAKAEHRWAAQMGMVVGDKQVREHVFTSLALFFEGTSQQEAALSEPIKQIF